MNPEDFAPLERYLRNLPQDTQEVLIAFEQIERILNLTLPQPAIQDPLWWSNQKQGMQVEAIAWMDAGWMVDTVDIQNKRIKFVRQ